MDFEKTECRWKGSTISCCDGYMNPKKGMCEKHEFVYFSELKKPGRTEHGTDTANGTPNTATIKRSIFKI